MKTLELRRHSDRKQGGGSQLSQKGVDRARRLGAAMGPFTWVVTSLSPRARETAIAMGFAVDEEIVLLTTEEDVYAEMETAQHWKAGKPYVALAGLLAKKGPSWRYAFEMVAALRDILTPLPDGASVLAIAHSGQLELILVTCFPTADHANWGPAIGHCEGARLTFGGEPERFIALEFLRDAG